MKVITTAGIEGWVRGSAYTAAGENEVILVWPSEASFENGGTDASELRKRNMDVIEEEADYDTMADALSEEFKELEEDITPPPVVLPTIVKTTEPIVMATPPVETNVSAWGDLVVGNEVEITLWATVDSIGEDGSIGFYFFSPAEGYDGDEITNLSLYEKDVVSISKRIVLTPGAVYSLSLTDSRLDGKYVYTIDANFVGIQANTAGYNPTFNSNLIKKITKA